DVERAVEEPSFRDVAHSELHRRAVAEELVAVARLQAVAITGEADRESALAGAGFFDGELVAEVGAGRLRARGRRTEDHDQCRPHRHPEQSEGSKLRAPANPQPRSFASLRMT